MENENNINFYPNPKKLICVRDAAILLDISEGRVRQLIEEGYLPATKINDRWFMLGRAVRRAMRRPKPGWPKGKPRGKKQKNVT